MPPTQVSALLTRVGYKIFDNASQTISTSSIPTANECIAWLNAEARILAEILASLNSDIGRSVKRIVTAKAVSISDISKANPGKITTVIAHGLSAAGGTCHVTGVDGMYQASELTFTYTYVDTASITIGVDTSAYDTYTGGGLVLAKEYYSDLNATPRTVIKFGDRAEVFSGQNKSEMSLSSRECIRDYSPTETGPPQEFFVDDSDYIYVRPHPDDIYIMMIPYWTYPTTLTATINDVPFGGQFDDLLVEGVADIVLNREEYDINFEIAMKNFLFAQAKVKAQKRRNYSGDVKA